jgi:hypothetical protein
MTLRRDPELARMAARRGWRDLGSEFTALGKRSRVEVVYYPDGSRGLGGVSVAGVEGEWECRRSGGKPTDVREFQRLARGAAVAAGHADHPDSWVYWLDGIRKNELGDFKESTLTLTEGAAPPFDVRSITNKAICRVSAQYCRLIASGAAASPRPKRPNVAAVVAPLMKRAAFVRGLFEKHHGMGFSYYAVDNRAELDKKTVKRLLAGRGVREKTLLRLATAYNLSRGQIPDE